MSEKLLPCPFCGSTEVEYDEITDSIFCECGASLESYLTTNSTVSIYNHRVYHPKVQAVLEAANKLYAAGEGSGISDTEYDSIVMAFISAVRALKEMEPANGQ